MNQPFQQNSLASQAFSTNKAGIKATAYFRFPWFSENASSENFYSAYCENELKTDIVVFRLCQVIGKQKLQIGALT